MDQQPVEPTTIASPATDSQDRTAPTGMGSRSASWLNLLLGFALVVAIGGLAFAAGRLTAPTQAGAFEPGGRLPAFQPGEGGTGTGPNGFIGAGGPAIEGTVVSIGETSMTVRTESGQTIQIALDQSTTYHTQARATADDVAAGEAVVVRLGLQQGAGTGGGPTASGGRTASDVTVMP